MMKKIGEWVLGVLIVVAIVALDYASMAWLLDWGWNILEWPTWWWVAVVTGVVVLLGFILTKGDSLLSKLFGYIGMAYIFVGFFANIFFMGYIPYRISDGSWLWTIAGFIIYAVLGIVRLILKYK